MTTKLQTGPLGEIVLDIYREVGDGNFLNRVCKEATTGTTAYYCESDANCYIQVHKGDKSGPVIASATQFIGKDGSTEVKLIGAAQRSIELKHVHGAFPFFHGNTFFKIGEKKVHWKGHSALVEDHTNVCLAVYKAKFLETKDRKLGTLLITAPGVPYLDIIVVSALVEQERSDEAEAEVSPVVTTAKCSEIEVDKGSRRARIYYDVK